MIHRFKQFMTTTTSRLALSYLAIIMLMSIGFSVVFYYTSSQQLGRQIPPRFAIEQQLGITPSQTQQGSDDSGDGTTDDGNRGNHGPSELTDEQNQAIRDFLQQRVSEGRRALLQRLVGLNLIALALGSGLSYYLARRTLRPIEANMEAQSQFVSDASHELRTPLTAMQTSNEVALRRTKLTEHDARAVIADNISDVVRLRTLTDGLLKLARHENGAAALQTVTLAEVVTEALNQVIPAATAKQIIIDDKIGKDLVKTEPDLLAQLIVIFVDNAIKYSPAKSNIMIVSKTHGKHVLLVVRDHGTGINPEDLPHIFDRFYRASSARTVTTKDGSPTGYGLGLSIAKKIAGQIGAQLEASSTASKGSQFTIRLPLA